jgi:hypothetical protein
MAPRANWKGFSEARQGAGLRHSPLCIQVQLVQAWQSAP